MSQALYNEFQELKRSQEAILEKISALAARLDGAVSLIDESAAERSALRKEVKALGGKVETLHALRQQIEKDAREFGGTRRDVIDPTTVKMPRVLKTLGYGAEAKQ